jgi:serine protease Do
VNSDSPALKARVVAGGGILGFDGHGIEGIEDPTWLAASAGIGTSVEMKVFREGREKSLKVVMGAIPEEGVEHAVDSTGQGGFIAGVGLAVADITREVRKAEKLPHKKGVRVTAVARGSAAWDERIRPGDFILQFGFAAVTNVKALRRMCDRLEPGRSLSLLVKRGNRTFWVPLRKR